ncbi:hypothetical protein Cgig2_018786 [Carnegiea gigantea]|uniref:Transposase-associated domain-containing protein n=1 Tax=Carnegiea gigantea TaxID=171969 RepID=A0A9Q1K8H8_9CARY|nr:hypothetical protein Cgig2_018786 [Carnegiea gigantea]
MAPSKHWMSLINERLNLEYEKGVREYITFAFGWLRNESKVIKCPCVRCKNSNDHQYSAETIEDHLIAYGILSGYTFWCHHGEIAGKNQLESKSLGFHHGNEDEFNEMEAEENKIDDEIDAIEHSDIMAQSGVQLSGKMACGGGKTLRRRFVAPRVLGRNRTPTSTLTPREMYAAECDEKDDQTRGVTKKEKFKGGGIENRKVQEIISTADKHPEFSQFELIGKCFGPQDHDHVICFGHGVTPKDVQGPQPSKVDLMTEIQEKNQQINSLTGRVAALESNH